MSLERQQIIVWFDTTMDADFWWEVMMTRGVAIRRPSARAVMWFVEEA